MEAVQADFAEHGVEAIKRVRADKPHEYLRLVANLLPKQLEVKDRDTPEDGRPPHTFDWRLLTPEQREHREVLTEAMGGLEDEEAIASALALADGEGGGSIQ